jgi:transglycosylase-like protein with SLT domain
MARDIRTNLITDDNGTPAFKSYANSAEAAASQLDGLSDSQRKLAIESEKASIRVERATRALTSAQNRYTKDSLQARDASVKLMEAQNHARVTQLAFQHAMEGSADAADDLADELDDVAGAQGRVNRSSGVLRTGLDKTNGALKNGIVVSATFVKSLAGVAAGGAAVGAVGLSIVGGIMPAVAALTKLTMAGAHVAPAFAPAAAALPAFGAAFLLVKTAIVGSGPQLGEAFTPLGKKLAAARDLTGDIASRHVPALARSFARANLPEIETFFRRIGHAEQYVIDQILKWSTTVAGQKTINTILSNTAGITERLSRLLPPVVTAFAEMVGRATGPGFKEIGQAGGALDRLAKGAEHLFDSVSGADVTNAFKRIEDVAGSVERFGKRVSDTGDFLTRNKDAIKNWSDILAGSAIVLGIVSGNAIPAVIGAVTLLTHHWDDSKKAMQGATDEAKRMDKEHGIVSRSTGILSAAVSGLVGWYREYLAPSMTWLGRNVMPMLRSAGDDLSNAFHSLSKDSAFWTGLLKVLGGILIGVVVGAVIAVVGILKGLSMTLRVAASFTHGLISAFMALRDGAERVGNDLHTWFHDLPGRVSRAVGGLGDLLKGKGSDLVSGLFRGSISAMTSGLGRWAGQIKDSIVGAVKRAFGISSPSKVFAGLGGHMMDGLVLGIVRNNPTSMIKRIFGGTTQALTSMVSSGIIDASRLTEKAFGALGSMFGGIGMGKAGSNTSGNRGIGKAMAAGYGWTGGQWAALEALWTGESGWNSNAKNPTSTAFGIPQFLKSTAAAYGLAYGNTNPAAQIAAGLRYIRDSYGSPAAAYGAWRSRSPHWYDAGGIAAGPGVMLKNTIRPERVLSPDQTVSFDRMVSLMGRGRQAAGDVLVSLSLPNYIGSRDEIRSALHDMFSQGKLDVILNRAALGRR